MFEKYRGIYEDSEDIEDSDYTKASNDNGKSPHMQVFD